MPARLFFFIFRPLDVPPAASPPHVTSNLHNSSENGPPSTSHRHGIVSLVVSLRSLVVRSPHALPLSTIRSERMTRLQLRCLAGFTRVISLIPTSCRPWVLGTCLLAAVGVLCPFHAQAQPPGNGRVALDFNEVDLSVFVRFISELTGKNFVLDDTVKKA